MNNESPLGAGPGPPPRAGRGKRRGCLTGMRVAAATEAAGAGPTMAVWTRATKAGLVELLLRERWVRVVAELSGESLSLTGDAAAAESEPALGPAAAAFTVFAFCSEVLGGFVFSEGRFWSRCAAYRISVPQPEIESKPPALGVQSQPLDHLGSP